MSCDNSDAPLAAQAQGDTWDIDVGPVVKVDPETGDSAPVNLTGQELIFTLKSKYDDPDSATKLRFSITVPAGEDAEAGLASLEIPSAGAVTVPPSNTSGVVPGNYFAWIQIVAAESPPIRHTIYSGTMPVTPAPQS